MDPLFVQNLRYKLQKRVSRLNSVDAEIFTITLAQFWQFFNRQPTFVGIAEELLAQFPDIDRVIDQIFKGEALHGETEEEAAAIGYGVLCRLIGEDGNGTRIAYLGRQYVDSVTKLYEALEVTRECFLEPFYEYVDEQLDDQRAMLALLIRYKHRSEWFLRERLWELSQTKRRGEKLLALDLYSYLYDQGIDFTIEPSSITGEVDLIAAQDSPDPLLLDTKIFDGDSRGKHYIRKGFAQLYTYTQQYNKPFGYLLIYKITERDLRFSLQLQRHIPVVVHNHKTLFLITIDIYPCDKPVSQRPPLQAVEITEEELVGMLGGAESE